MPATFSRKCNISLKNFDIILAMKGGKKEEVIVLPPNEVYKLKVGYPLDADFTFDIKSSPTGLVFDGLVGAIQHVYQLIYQDVKKYGVWGHSLGDLFLESVKIDYNRKTINIGIGS